ncbi:MAG: hypothetical protein AAGJ18_00890 [Bacteroidota bacterium]
MEAFTVFKIAVHSTLIVQWFYYEDNNLEGFGVEPNGDWFRELYPDKLPFSDFERLDGTEMFSMLVQDTDKYNYLISKALPPHLVLKPNHKSYTDP